MNNNFTLSHPKRMIVVGTNLSAGFGDFSLNRESQPWSYPAQLARQLGIGFTQPLFEPPGLGEAPGFESQPVVVPYTEQSTVFDTVPPADFDNISIPGYTLDDVIRRRPQEPMIRRGDPVQTACNFILGSRDLPVGNRNVVSAVEYAAQRTPSLAIVELGFTEAARAAVAASVDSLSAPEEFRRGMDGILSALGNSSKIVLTVPDPFDTAHFFNVAAAAEALRVETEFLHHSYGLADDDLLRLPAVNDLAFDIFAGRLRPLRLDCVVRSCAAAGIRARIDQWNHALKALAAEHGALLFDLHCFQRTISERGELAGTRWIMGTWLGGYYRLNGWYPGRTGHALIANGILETIERAAGNRLSRVDLHEAVAHDPACACAPASGRKWTSTELRARLRPADPPGERRAPGGPSATPHELPDPGTGIEPLPAPLRIPGGYTQLVRLNPDASYFGDGISASLCSRPLDIQWGSMANHLFGGFAMVDSHLHGDLRFHFEDPQGDTVRFEVAYVGALDGEDTELSCPVFFRMPFRGNRVENIQGRISSGEVDLTNGVVSKLRIYSQFRSEALDALVGCNPTFPRDPLCFVTTDIADPQREYGSAWAKFTQRPDGILDFTFYGARFVPLGAGIKWPLNYCGPDHTFATVPADGTAMHPHLRLSTVEGGSPAPPSAAAAGVAVVPNSVQELTFHTHNTAFGDLYTLDIPELGGPGKGRSQILGRALIQFGTPTRNTIPVAVINLAPGGMMVPVRASRITKLFPKGFTPGPTGFDEFLRFPLRTYALDELTIIDDPFDVAVGAMDLSTGMLFPEHLHRGFIEQDLIYAVFKHEPGTPKSSFYFRGPAVVETNRAGRLVFRHRSQCHVIYIQGYKFPEPNLDQAYVVRTEGALDPFLWIHAEQDDAGDKVVLEHEVLRVLSSVGDLFSCRFRLASDPSDLTRFFRYENHSQDGTFQLLGLTWITFGASTGSSSIDTVTFSGFGAWVKGSHRSLRQISAQVCTNPNASYVGIQIDTGDVSNVNTKPVDERLAYP